MTTPTTPVIGSDAPDIDLLVNQHETFRARFVYRVAGVAQGLEGLDARLSVGYRRGGRALFTLTLDDGLTLEPEDEDGEHIVGAIDIEISAARSGLLRRDAVYDLLLINSDEEPPDTDRLFEGRVLVNRGMTAPA